MASQNHLTFSLASEQYFHQDIARGKNAASLGTVYNFPECFGLKSGDWKGFDQLLEAKNAEDPERVRYVVIFLARHGQGYHNVGEEYVGSKVWKGVSKISPETPIHKYFPDAHLTSVGQHQADTLSARFGRFLNEPSNSLPWPQQFYVSPLHRALETSYRTWAPLSDNHGPGRGSSVLQRKVKTCEYHPIILEQLREQIFIEHCNKRSTRSEIEEFEFGYTTPPTTSPTTSESEHLSSDLPTQNLSPENQIKARRRKESKPKKFNEIFSFYTRENTNSTTSATHLKPMTEQDEHFTHQSETLQHDESNHETTQRAHQALCLIFKDIFSESPTYPTKSPDTNITTTEELTNDNNEVLLKEQSLVVNKDIFNESPTTPTTPTPTPTTPTTPSEHHKSNEKKPKVKYISLTTHAGLMSGLYRALGVPEKQVPRFPTGIVIPLVVRIQNSNSHGTNSNNTVNDTIINDISTDIDVDLSGGGREKGENFIPSYSHPHPQFQSDTTITKGDVIDHLKGKSLDDVLREIRDGRVYERLILRVERWRSHSRDLLLDGAAAVESTAADDDANNDGIQVKLDVCHPFDDEDLTLIERKILTALI